MFGNCFCLSHNLSKTVIICRQQKLSRAKFENEKTAKDEYINQFVASTFAKCIGRIKIYYK